MKIELDVLIKCVESIVLKRPTYIDELITSLHSLLKEDVEPAYLESALQALEEKYNADFFGFTFCYNHRQVFFSSRSIADILGLNNTTEADDIIVF